MAALDRLKEETAYLKVWLGIAVVSEISLAGWLISASDTAASSTFVIACTGVLLISFAVLIVHRRIERRIAQVGDL